MNPQLHNVLIVFYILLAIGVAIIACISPGDAEAPGVAQAVVMTGPVGPPPVTVIPPPCYGELWGNGDPETPITGPVVSCACTTTGSKRLLEWEHKGKEAKR